MALEILVNTGSGNGLLPDGTKPLPEPMLTYHQQGSVAFIWGHHHRRFEDTHQWSKIENYTYKITLSYTGGQWVNMHIELLHDIMTCLDWTLLVLISFKRNINLRLIIYHFWHGDGTGGLNLPQGRHKHDHSFWCYHTYRMGHRQHSIIYNKHSKWIWWQSLQRLLSAYTRLSLECWMVDSPNLTMHILLHMCLLMNKIKRKMWGLGQLVTKETWLKTPCTYQWLISYDLWHIFLNGLLIHYWIKIICVNFENTITPSLSNCINIASFQTSRIHITIPVRHCSIDNTGFNWNNIDTS